MSSLPGYTLEAFVAWNYDLIVNGDGSSNPSLCIAEALGNVAPRKGLTTEEFRTVVVPFEPYREQVELGLELFDEQENGWRQYHCYSPSFELPDEVFDAGSAAIKALDTKS